MAARWGQDRGDRARRGRRSLFPSLQGYRRSYLRPDALAALTLLAIAVPEQLATSRLAGMPPLTGFYAFVAGGIGFALLGASRRLSVGADSTIAPLFAAGVAGMAATGSARYVDLVGILSVLVGVLLALVAVLRLGWVAQYLSTPIITGFLAGVAVIIVVHQLPDLLGIAAPTGGDLHRIAVIATHLGDARAWSVGIGLAVLVVVVACERVDRRLPAALVGLVVATVVVALTDGRAHGVAVLGAVPRTPPRFWLDGLSWSALRRLTPLAVVVALVVVSQTAATEAAFPAASGAGADDVGGTGHDRDLVGVTDRDRDTTRDFAGVGVGNILAGLAGAFPVNASPPRTAAVAASGGRTQLTTLLAVAAVACLVPAASLLDDVPLSALAAILLWVASRIVRGRDLVAIARFNRFELALAAIGMVTVAFVGVEQGIAVAVGLAVLDRAQRSARPQLHVLGRIPGTTSYVPVSGTEPVEQVPGVLVVLFATPLWYANADHFQASIGRALGRAVGTPRVLVLDALGMSDIDYTGVVALRAGVDELERRGITVAVARAGHTLRKALDRSGLARRIGEDRFFASVGEAVAALAPEPPGPPAPPGPPEPPVPPVLPDPPMP